ncbi:hypothetical protein [Deinococcus sp. UYEF24]
MTRQKTTSPMTHRPAFSLGSLIGIGAGMGLVAGILLSDLVVGMMYGAAAGTLVGSVLEVHGRRADQPDAPPLAVFPRSGRWLIGCLVFLGVSALLGGAGLVSSPSGAALHIPLSVLHASPFRDFLIPGLILGVVFGVGSLVAVLALWQRPSWPSPQALNRLTGEHWAWSAALVLGVGQIIWIVTETVMLRGASWLGLIYGSLGVLIVVLVFQPDVRRYFALGVASHDLAESLR